MKKVSAVEWLIEQLTEVDYNCINKTFLQSDNSLAGYKMRKLFKKAKEMEKNLYICNKCKSQINEKEIMQQVQDSKKSD